MNRVFRNIMRLPVPWVFALLYLLGAVLDRCWPICASLRNLPGCGICGVILLVSGVGIAGWGLFTFRKAQTTTVPGEASSQLVNWGPYQYTRNPMYVGLALAYLGEAGILRQLWPIVLLPLVLAYLNWVVIPVEEAKLREVFGDRYVRYQERVRRWM